MFKVFHLIYRVWISFPLIKIYFLSYDAIWDFRFSIMTFYSFSQELVFNLLNFSCCSCNCRDVISCLISNILFMRNNFNAILFACMSSTSFWLHKIKRVRLFFLSSEFAFVLELSVLLRLSRSNLASATGVS